MHGVVLDVDSLHPPDLDLQPVCTQLVPCHLYPHTDAEQVQERITGAQVVITNKVALTADHIQSSPALKLICVAATGTNNIDLEAATRAGIQVCNARDYATASVVEHVFALLLTLTRRLDRYRDCVRRGDWYKSQEFCVFDEPIGQLSGQTLGIIGYGTLGKAVAQAAQAFSMNVQVAQSLQGTAQPGRVALESLLATSDVISLHCPLSDTTRGLIGAAELSSMKPGAILINTARGGIVDEQALVDALQQKAIHAAAIDVLADEPPQKDHPLLNLQSPRLIVTPHVAWASQTARQQLIDELAKNITAFLRGRPRNLVN
ncbi:glycerate dehydrogenase [Thiogranum longum]|uniref:Glycerate dehydrogenase n=1 Tax=Thiogranum longum TaxID=1537524 RepID=A0A4R1HPH3_9GAMM|nr:D-2-hydroxyacid dehydrogenase [Thiogranum longum]TCK19182.1 glycerate dehydrogenase [Thiogranum longum]